SYRFKTFYIAPNQRNFEDFFSEVVEPGWLNNSRDPRAVALREARSNPNQAWRVLHRVTFVSRIPPEFQAFPLESQAPDIEEPVNLDANSYLLDLVRLRLPEGEPPTPVQIGKAVRAVLSDDLVEVIPWWATFLEEAREVNSEAYVRSTTLTSDTIDYVVGYYASLNLRGLERTS